MSATVGNSNRRDASKNRDVSNSNYTSKVPATGGISTTIHASNSIDIGKG
jgi:hypothetical protein